MQISEGRPGPSGKKETAKHLQGRRPSTKGISATPYYRSGLSPGPGLGRKSPDYRPAQHLRGRVPISEAGTRPEAKFSRQEPFLPLLSPLPGPGARAPHPIPATCPARCPPLSGARAPGASGGCSQGEGLDSGASRPSLPLRRGATAARPEPGTGHPPGSVSHAVRAPPPSPRVPRRPAVPSAGPGRPARPGGRDLVLLGSFR